MDSALTPGKYAGKAETEGQRRISCLWILLVMWQSFGINSTSVLVQKEKKGDYAAEALNSQHLQPASIKATKVIYFGHLMRKEPNKEHHTRLLPVKRWRRNDGHHKCRMQRVGRVKFVHFYPVYIHTVSADADTVSRYWHDGPCVIGTDKCQIRNVGPSVVGFKAIWILIQAKWIHFPLTDGVGIQPKLLQCSRKKHLTG